MIRFAPAFIVHGGAWDIPDEEAPGHLDGCRAAAQIGWTILQQGGSALDAVEAAIRSLEDNTSFDAGRGAWLNSAGEVELDAIIMNGATLDNGTGAERFAQAQDIPLCVESELPTGRELERWHMCCSSGSLFVTAFAQLHRQCE